MKDVPLTPDTVSQDAMAAFAAEWIAAWNSHDLQRILAHYDAAIVFLSPNAQRLTGSGQITGKAALADYWAQALQRFPDLHFTALGWRAGWNAMTILYANERGQDVAESMEFGADGLITRSMACYAALPSLPQ